MTQVTKEFFKGLSKAVVSGTRSGSHKMLYQHFQVMKSVWGESRNVEPVAFGIDSIVGNFASLIKNNVNFFFFMND